MIDTKEDLDAFIASLSKEGKYLCAIDTEADSLHRYAESLCLIQFSDKDSHILIDPLLIEDLSSLAVYLEKASVWMHGADYDMTMLKRRFGIIPPLVFDTQVAARLLGVQKFGLANLVEHFLGVTLCKGSQKADWGQRPLSDTMTEYALNDVRYLFPLADILVTQLKERGRYDWFLQSCEAARDKVLQRSTKVEDPWRISGSGKLKSKGLAYLRAMWDWREKEAKSWDKPTFMVVSNKAMIDWALGLEVDRFPRYPKHFRTGRRERFQKIIDAVRELPVESYPQRVRSRRQRTEEDFEDKVKVWLKRRNDIAGDLEIDPSLIAPRALFERLVLNEEEAIKDFLPWQKQLLDL